MQRKTWQKRFVAMLVGGLLAANAVTCMAAPVELTLEQAIKMAFANSWDGKMAASDQEKARWDLKQAKAALGPTLDYSHASSRYQSYNVDNNGNNDYFQKNKFDNSLAFSYPLYSGGKLEGAVDKAKINVQYYDLAYTDSQRQIKLDATNEYFNILQYRNVVKLDTESVEQLDAHLKNVQAQYSAGVVAKSDVLRSEVEKATAVQTLIKDKNSYQLAVATLNNLIGLPQATELLIKDDLKHDEYKNTIEDCIQYGLAHRVDIAQANDLVASAEQDIRISASGKKVTLNLSAQSDWNDSSYPGTDNNTWQVMLTAGLNLMDSGLTDAKVKSSQAALAKAKESARKVIDAAQLDIRSAYLSMREAEKRIETSSVSVSQAEEDFNIAQVRYAAGVGTNIDVIDAQVALTTAKNNYVSALYDFNTNRTKLDKAMGIDVQ